MNPDGVAVTLVLALFVGTQGMYLFGGLVLNWLLVFGARSTVRTPTDQSAESITVLIPLYKEPRTVIEETLSELGDQTYDLAKVQIVLVYEVGDPVVAAYVDDLVAADAQPWTLRSFGVEHADEALVERISLNWPLNLERPLPRTKAFALSSVFHSLEFDSEEIITVFDADTLIAPDLFALAVAGLEEYDIVQSKQTVRNIDDGVIPKLEAMGMATWSDVIYPRTVRGPYQLLGKGYFLRYEALEALKGWQPDEVTEDMAFGVAAYKRGLTLGVLDSYVQDLCPAEMDAWIRQKRRWLGGPYRVLANQPLSAAEKTRLVSVTMINQAVSLNTLIGLPAGIAAFVLVLDGYVFPRWLSLVILLNLLNWIAYSAAGYRATLAAVQFTGHRQFAWFLLISNPFTQSLYAVLWSLPLLLAAWDQLTGAPAVFEVTPKRV